VAARIDVARLDSIDAVRPVWRGRGGRRGTGPGRPHHIPAGHHRRADGTEPLFRWLSPVAYVERPFTAALQLFTPLQRFPLFPSLQRGCSSRTSTSRGSMACSRACSNGGGGV